MSVRERIGANSYVSGGIASGCILVAIGFIAYSQHNREGVPPSMPSHMTYTVDDGKTTFVDTVDRIGPFQHDGKEAVTAHMFKCGSQTFVGYLERAVTADKIQDILAIRSAIAARATTRPGATADSEERRTALTSLEVRKAGTTKWVRESDVASGPIMTVLCPDSHEPAQEIYP